MKKILIVAGILILGGVAVAVASDIIPTKVNYKVTIEVNTPDGIKSGSAVRQIKITSDPLSFMTPDLKPYSYNVVGEAVVVDLNDKGLLFGLIDEQEYVLLEKTFNAPVASSEKIDFYKQLEVGQKLAMKGKQLKLVRFEDINNPKSIQRVGGEYFDIDVQKYVLIDEFEKTYGLGYSLNNISIEISEEKMTAQLKKYLPWFVKYKNKARYLGGKSKMPYDDPSQIRARPTNFKRSN